MQFTISYTTVFVKLHFVTVWLGPSSCLWNLIAIFISFCIFDVNHFRRVKKGAAYRVAACVWFIFITATQQTVLSQNCIMSDKKHSLSFCGRATDTQPLATLFKWSPWHHDVYICRVKSADWTAWREKARETDGHRWQFFDVHWNWRPDEIKRTFF